MSKTIVVSNRSALASSVDAGGLVSALADGLTGQDTLWVGSSIDAVSRPVPGSNDPIRRKIDHLIIDLSAQELRAFYTQYANRVLWPAFHERPDLIVPTGSGFPIYRAVNKKFAEAIITQAREADLIWVHDYHLLMVAKELRALGWQGAIGLFLHVPFPKEAYLKSVPHYAQLLSAISNFDMVGFQTDADRDNYSSLVRPRHSATNGADGFNNQVLKTVPVGIDPERIRRHFQTLDSSQSTNVGRTSACSGEVRLIGADRLDYSKGLLQKFGAIDRLLARNPKLHGRVTLRQIVSPSRTQQHEYVELAKSLEAAQNRINKQYGSQSWQPIQYQFQTVPRDALFSLFRGARVGLVTPLLDGMNLVSKEYVASQDPNNPGVLVLSNRAGSAAELEGAILVDPEDDKQVADAILKAMSMPLEERKKRWQKMWHRININTADNWVQKNIQVLQHIVKMKHARALEHD